MEKQPHFIYLCLFLYFTAMATEASAHDHGFTKLFVFGDSYVDTGNGMKGEFSSWMEPYGITFPGKPAGRFSDGRVFTDYIASWMGIRSPIPYERRKKGKKVEAYGMNFAYGGSGVFETLVDAPNMTTQINLFQQLLEEKIFSRCDLDSSMALVSLAGNDYTAYLARNGTPQGLPAFTTSMIKQLSLNLRRIHGLGVKKVAVMAIEPLGCLPQVAAISSYPNCNASDNLAAKFHNQVLEKTVKELNNETKEHAFLMLDLYNAFMSAMKKWEHHPGKFKFKDPLRPCCVGVTSEYSCGEVDEFGMKKYTVCSNPKLALFWDYVHPSQAGWHAIYSALKSSIHDIY